MKQLAWLAIFLGACAVDEQASTSTGEAAVTGGIDVTGQ
jgi:hypothetical protein